MIGPNSDRLIYGTDTNMKKTDTGQKNTKALIIGKYQNVLVPFEVGKKQF